MAVDLTLILPGLVIGLIAGIVDLFFMIKDESGSAGMVISHGLGAFVPIIIFSMISMNLSWVMTMDWAAGTILANEIVMRIALLLVVAIVIYSKSKLFKGAGSGGTGMHESFGHTLIVAGIVASAPYLWMLIGPMMPIWLGGS